MNFTKQLFMKKVYGLVLAGGRGMRMGGRNKGLLRFNHRALVQNSIDLLRGSCDEVLISANRDLVQYRDFGLRVITDCSPWIDIGPLGGLASVYRQLPSEVETLQLLPCDVPFMRPHVIDKLDGAMRRAWVPVYAQHDDHWHPLVSRWPVSALAGLEAYLEAASSYAVFRWLKRQNAQPVHFANAAPFININDPTTLQKYQDKADDTDGI